MHKGLGGVEVGIGVGIGVEEGAVVVVGGVAIGDPGIGVGVEEGAVVVYVEVGVEVGVASRSSSNRSRR